jgi:hypothetical protein
MYIRLSGATVAQASQARILAFLQLLARQAVNLNFFQQNKSCNDFTTEPHRRYQLSLLLSYHHFPQRYIYRPFSASAAMSEGQILKPDKDFSKEVDKQLPEAEQLAQVRCTRLPTLNVKLTLCSNRQMLRERSRS